MRKVFLCDTLWSGRTDAIEKFTVRGEICSLSSSKLLLASFLSLSLSLTFLLNKSPYTLMSPPPFFVFMSLDISTKSQCVAPQARRRYLVIYIEIYGPK